MFTLIAIGVVMIYSSSAVYADQKFGSSGYFLRRHLFYVVIGTIGFALSSALNPFFLKRYSVPILGIGILLLIAVFLPLVGRVAYGARRWIQLPFFTFQPVEFVKLAMCIYLS